MSDLEDGGGSVRLEEENSSKQCLLGLQARSRLRFGPSMDGLRYHGATRQETVKEVGWHSGSMLRSARRYTT